MLESKIYAIVDSFIEDKNEMPSQYNSEGKSLTEAIEEVFKDSDIQHSIEDIQNFESCGYDCGIVSVAFIEDGKLYHMNFEWERC